ncbi:MAG: type II toxin-antitoxin system VapC family toxin [Terracidiphilus sp.]
MTVAAEADRKPLLLLDTHTLIWSVEEGPRLGRRVKTVLNEAARQSRIAVSAITPWEIALLVAKNRVQLGCDVMQWVREALARAGVLLIPLEPEIAVACSNLPFEMHADPTDRILVATARHLGATLVTADERLLDLARKGQIKALNAAA